MYKHQEIVEGLAKPFRKDEELTREQGGKTFTYAQIQSYEQRLDEVVGIGGWQCRYEFGPNGEIVCYLGIQFGEEWVWKADGAGQTNFEAEKGGLTDAFKRACKRFGLGRYFYWGDSPPKKQPTMELPWKKAQLEIVFRNAPTVDQSKAGRFLDVSGLKPDAEDVKITKYCRLYQGKIDENATRKEAMKYAKAGTQ